MNPEQKWRAKHTILAVLAAVAIIGYAIYSAGKSPTPAPTPNTYNDSRICEEFTKTYDYSRETKMNTFVIPLQEGCFGPLISMPRSWKTWHSQPTGDQTGYWIAFWWTGWPKGRGAFGPNDSTILNTPSWYFRVQGHGTVRFISNDVVPVATPEESENDSNIPFLKRSPITPPVQLTSSEPEYTNEARAAHFNGKVIVKLTVGTDGAAHDIVIPNSPGYGLDEKIIETLGRWTFKPGERDGVPIAVKSTVTIEFHQF